MSSGVFLNSKYETDDLEVAPCRVQPETITAWNPAPTADTTLEGSANMGGSRRRNGINARYISGKWKDLTPPAGYVPYGRVRIPILTNTGYEAISKGDELTYLGATLIVTGKTGEKVN